METIGAISPFAPERLNALGVPLPSPHRFPLHVRKNDLQAAHLIVAMYDREHRPLVAERIPAWLDRIEFWEVPDVDFVPPETALPEIERKIRGLVIDLSQSKAASA